jgi:hypothetical protein
LHYTDPVRDSVVPAFAIAEAHALPAETQEYLHADINGLNGDIIGLFGMFSDLFRETNADASSSKPAARTPSHMPALQTRIDELHDQLYSHNGQFQTKTFFAGGTFPEGLATAVFTANNFEDCIWSYFTVFHPQHPFIHWPTFDVHEVSLPLLLAVVFAGSVHCTPRDAALSARSFFDLAEDFIFERLRARVAKKEVYTAFGLQSIQAALLILALQISFNDEATRRRIRICRHPELVASMRSLGLTSPGRTSFTDVSHWNAFIAEESRAR